ncbi:hypothetical protein L083_4653 [Actinoplanes sp. N902-109]|nr:hypothetical protein L083_4653 [Actinoplanes sp. N902-109]
MGLPPFPLPAALRPRSAPDGIRRRAVSVTTRLPQARIRPAR